MKTFEIGTRVYPVDNSWSYTIGTNENLYLAGTYCTPAKKVMIVSKPYIIIPPGICEGYKDEYEFVTVMYKRKCHVVLNNFRENNLVKYYDAMKPEELDINEEIIDMFEPLLKGIFGIEEPEEEIDETFV